MATLKKIFGNTIVGKFVKSIIVRINGKKHQRYHDAEVAKVRKYGVETLSTFDRCMNDNGFHYSLATGTLLGAIREHGFIPHDEDIDVFMWIEDFNTRFYDIMEAAGFTLQHSFSIENDKYGKEDSFLYKGVQLDVFYVYPPIDKYPYFTDYFYQHGCKNWEMSIKKFGGLLPRRLSIPIIKQTVLVPFENLMLPVPINAKEVLSFRYGEDFMIPNAKWSAGQSNPNVVEWPEKLGVIRCLNAR